MSINDSTLRDILAFDPLASAEVLTGKSYKEDKATEMIGLIGHLDNNKVKIAALQAGDDTTHSNDLPNYLRIVQEEGFKEVLRVPFHDSDKWGGERDDALFVFWHNDGILMAFDTYCGDRVNGGHFYYNVRANEPYGGDCRWTSSGGWDTETLYVGHHDCREALRFNLRQIRAHGTFLPVWEKRGYLWLCHYGDTHQAELLDGYDKRSHFYDNIRNERIAMLPPHVQAAIAGGAQ